MDIIDIALWGSFALIVIAAAAAIFMPIINSLDDPKSLAQAGIGVAGLLVIFFISYLIAGDEITAKYVAVEFTDPGSSKLVGGVLIMTYIMGAIAALGIVFTEVNKMMK